MRRIGVLPDEAIALAVVFGHRHIQLVESILNRMHHDIWAADVGMVYSAAKTARKLSGIQYQIDPTLANIPGAATNLERGLFDTIRGFRFEDAHTFDFRGVSERPSNGRSGIWLTPTSEGVRASLPLSRPRVDLGKGPSCKIQARTVETRFGLCGLASDGAGCYIGGLAADVFVRANGSFSPNPLIIKLELCTP